MKKLLYLFLCCVTALIARSEETSDVNYGQVTTSPPLELIWTFDYTNYNDQVCAIITGVKNSGGTTTVMGDISVPESVVIGDRGYVVKAIAADAFKNQLGISSISISKYVEDIGLPFCSGCTALSSIAVDENNYWFSEHNGMLYDSYKEILYACPPAKNLVQLPASTIKIGESAFDGCYRITAIDLPSDIDIIGTRAFADCRRLKTVTFSGDEPTSIDDGIFTGSTKVTVRVPDGNTTFGTVPGTWHGRPIEYITKAVPSTVVTEEHGDVTWSFRVIDGKAELYNNEQSCIDKSVSVTYHIDDETGSWVSDGTLSIPTTLKGYPVNAIGQNAFKGCSAITSLTIPGSVVKIGENAFAECTGIKSISIPDSVTEIGYRPLEGSSLTALALPDSLRTMDGNPLAGCDTMLTVTINSDNSYFTVVDGLIYDKDKKLLIGCPARKETATIASTCTGIGPEAFLGCFRINSLSLPEKVQHISESAFSGMPRLTSLVIPASVTAIDGAALFGTDAAIETIEFAGNAPSVNDDLFLGTPAELVVIVPEGSTGWDGDPASTTLPASGKWPTDGENGRTIKFKTAEDSPTGDDPVGRQEFKDSSGNTWLYTVENGKAILGHWGSTPVLKNPSITGIVALPESLGGYPLSAIPDRAFENCANITCIEIPASINAIGEGVFNGCTALEEIKVDSASTRFRSRYGALYSKDGKTLLKVPAKFDFDWTIITTTNEVEKVWRICTQHYELEGETLVLHPATTNVLSVGSETSKTTTNAHTAAVTQKMLFSGVNEIADYAFTDCGKVNVPDGTRNIKVIAAIAKVIGSNTAVEQTILDRTVSYDFYEPLRIPSSVTLIHSMATKDSYFTNIGGQTLERSYIPQNSNANTGHDTTPAMISTSSTTAKTTYGGWVSVDGIPVGTITAKTNTKNILSGSLLKIGSKKISVKSAAQLNGYGNVFLGEVFNGFNGKVWTLVFATIDNGGDPLMNGFTTLSITVKSKGTVSISGYAADGTKISTTAKLIRIGSDIYLPMTVQLYSGKKGGFSVLGRIANDGQLSIESHSAFYGASTTVDIAASDCGNPDVVNLDNLICTLPFGYSIDSKPNWKPRYTAKTGTITGSFKVLDPKGKKTTIKVYGVSVNGTGYATSVIPKILSIPTEFTK